MNNNFSSQPFRSGHLPSNGQSHNLNKLLQQTATKNVAIRQNMPEYSRQSNINMNTELQRQQQRIQRFMLQKQNMQQNNSASSMMQRSTHQNIPSSSSMHRSFQQSSAGASNQVIQRSIPPMFSPPVHKPQQQRQYVLVRHPQVKMQPSNSAPNAGPQRHPSNSGQGTVTLGGQIQLGQTYQFDVKRSQQLAYPGSIILKHSPSMNKNPSQRIPMNANDKGKFIPFSNLMIPGSTLESHVSNLHSRNMQLKVEQSPVIPSNSTQPKQVVLSISPKYKAPPVPMNLTQSAFTNRQPSLPVKTSLDLQKFSQVPTGSTPIIKQEFKMAVGGSQGSLPPQNVEPFDWDEYLKVTNSSSAPHTAFKHVEISLHNGFTPGMKLEVANKSNPATYWVATLISTCGQLLLLRFDGYGEDRKTDFWADVRTADLHPIGWCAQNGKVLQPPEAIRNMHENWADFLVRNLIGARTAPERLLSGPYKGKTVVEMIEPKMLLEVQDLQHPQHVWMADVVKNIGGRLLLRYKGLSDNDTKFDFWLFYLDVRLHQVGWGKEHRRTMKPPNVIRHKYSRNEEWAYVLSMSLKGLTEQDLVPACVFNDQVKLKPHDLRETWKLAVLDPVNPTRVRPATVVKVVDKYFFLAELDDVRHQGSSCAFLCHSGSSVFPIDWCRRYEIPVTPPGGYSARDFNWNSYLRQTNCPAAPQVCFASVKEKHEFTTGMKLEACNPYNSNEICVASIVAVYGHVLRLQLSTQSGSGEKHIQCFVHSSSHDIFPVGWCDSNNYPLSAPQSWRQKPFISANVKTSFPNKKVAVVQPEVQVKENDKPEVPEMLRDVINPSSNSKFWCPVVCFNSSCNSGVFINNHALSKVPRYVGPGNTALVMKEVISLLVGAAERPHKLLKDMEDFTVDKGSEPCIIKAKFEGKKYQATLHIVNTASQVVGYFKAITSFLKCCPNLLTLQHAVTECPLACTKERGPGRPPGSTKSLTSNRGRKKKVAEDKVNSTVSKISPPRPIARTDIKCLRSKSLPYRPLRHHRFPSKYHNHAMQRERTRSSHQSVRKSVHELSKHEKMDLKERLRRRRKKMKIDHLHLETNPLKWNVEDTVKFLETTECAEFASAFLEQSVDGQSLLLLTLPVIQESLDLKLGPALKLARQVERVKISFFENFANQ